MRKITHTCKSLSHAESKNTTPVTKRLVFGFPEHTKRSFQLPKTCYLRRLLPQNGPVCGNGHAFITTCKLRRNYFFRLVRIYLCSAWRDESEYIHFDAYITNFIKTIIFLLHFRDNWIVDHSKNQLYMPETEKEISYNDLCLYQYWPNFTKCSNDFDPYFNFIFCMRMRK